MSESDSEKKNECPFCNIEEIKDRIFYESDGWVAFLAAPFYAKGHTILSAIKTEDKCPENLLKDITSDQLKVMGKVLKEVFQTIKNIYKVENVTISSLRGTVKHFHFHLIPIHKQRERSWRIDRHHEKGHLFEYLGQLEKDGVEEALIERIEKEWCEKQQREEITKGLKRELEQLKKITGHITH